ncbi:hypothetical protein ACIBH1_43140 [Nonomuraea sp. NPDC050663]|uniref:hypothetical protein n=1 Tax=Nonomuraea sp. NPDC050663 TaxID=3364370 RepID=UPI0037B1645A
MNNAPNVHAFRLGDVEMVAMSQDDYHLLGARRQMGAQGNRLRGLRTQLDQAQARLDRISELVKAGHTPCDHDCVRCAVAALIDEPLCPERAS